MEDIEISKTVTIPARELRISFARSGGPGGQNINKVETKVELRWAAAGTSALSGDALEGLLLRLARRLTAGGELVITSSRTREQFRNREDAQAKLAEIVREALRPPRARKSTRPSKQAKERRLREKKERSLRKKERRLDEPAALE